MTNTSAEKITSDAGSRMSHREWMGAAEVEYARLADLLASLSEGDWEEQTDCDSWNVRQVVAHLVGAAESTARMREMRRQQKLGRALRPGVDGMNEVQVSERADVPAAQLRADLDAAGVRGVQARRRISAAVRAIRIPFGPPLGVRSVGYLMDRVYTRDAWMHRVDIARATARVLVLTPGHDGRLVADIVGEWARVHGLPYVLTLTGPAGGHWSKGSGGPNLTLDAVQFCRILSGRDHGTSLLATQVPF
jgi:uncharacterized protein (TIGR03083 family)